MTSTSTDKDELISVCRNEYKDNSTELVFLREFEQGYSDDRSLWRYTRDSFLYCLLNKALRVQNIDLLFIFRFFIRDIERELELNRCSSAVRVYLNWRREERDKKCMCVHSREVIIAIGTVKTVFNFRVGRCLLMGDVFPAKIAPWDRDLVQNGRCSLTEIFLYFHLKWYLKF
jgi:hypothetical protein